ncbi:MAG: hypothetical protein AAB400_03795, partial [Patescibacteria group bacterium]
QKAVKNIQEKGALEQQQQGVSSGNTRNAIDPAKLANPSLLSPQEIRTILESSGKVPLDVLQKVPDAALKDIFMKAVQGVQK